MNDDQTPAKPDAASGAAPGGYPASPMPESPLSPAAERALSPAARRALAEADERRRLAAGQEAARPKEVGGRNGPDPIRYGDWEKGGIVSDF